MPVTMGSKVHSIVTIRGRVGDETGLPNWPSPRKSNAVCQTQHAGLTTSFQPSPQPLKKKKSFCSKWSLYSKYASYGSSQMRVFSLQNCLACMLVQMLIRETAVMWTESNCWGRNKRSQNITVRETTLGANTHCVFAPECQLNSRIHRVSATHSQATFTTLT